MEQETNYKVTQRPIGPAGWIDYTENGKVLSFPREPITNGFSILVPSEQEWNNFCSENLANWAMNRRSAIIENLISEMRNAYNINGVSVNPPWIEVRYKRFFGS